MSRTRPPGWRARLEAWLAQQARRPFRPGEFDCLLFAVGARAAVTGIDLLAPHDARYGSLAEGFDLLAAAGWADHVEFATQGLTEIPPALAATGDLAVLPGEDGWDALGVVAAEHVVAVTPRGTALAPLTAARRAWRV